MFLRILHFLGLTNLTEKQVEDFHLLRALSLKSNGNLDFEFHKQLMDGLPQVVFAKNCKMEFIYVNSAFKDMFKVKDSEVLGRTDADFFRLQSAAEEFKKDDLRVLESGSKTPQINHELIEPREGERFYLQTTKIPIWNSKGDVDGMLGVASDISELHDLYEGKIRDLDIKVELLEETEKKLRVLTSKKSMGPIDNHKIKVFVSYKHSGDEHAKWVEKFTKDLIEIHGIDCILDRFDLGYGESIPAFMQRIKTEATHVLLIATPQSVEAVETNSGGIAFEAQLAMVLRDEGALKFIPVLRSGNQTPAYMRSHLYVDFRRDDVYLDMLKRLAQAIQGKGDRPSLGIRNAEG